MTYPRKGQEVQLKVSKDRRCRYCPQPATRRVDIEINYYRGDDVPVNVCNDHSKSKVLIPLWIAESKPAPNAGEEGER